MTEVSTQAPAGARAGVATRLWALEGPTFNLPANFLVVHEEGQVTIPVPCFLIEHPRGLVLFDTGIIPEASEDPLSVYSPETLEFNHLRYDPAQRVDRQIEALGYTVEDVKHVVLSHLHDDHTGGLRFFPHADIWIGEGELPHAYWPHPPQRNLFRYRDIDPARDFTWHELPGDHDLFGDGSVIVLRFPGHTPGSSGLLVRLPSRNLILTGDAVHLRAAVEKTMPMGTDWNTAESVRSIRRMKRLAASTPAEIWIGHDPQDWEHYTSNGHELS
jgi:N-acyl homoserine lactone hydrolase